MVVAPGRRPGEHEPRRGPRLRLERDPRGRDGPPAAAPPGIQYEEALRSGLLDPALPDAERALYVSRHAGLEACAPLNHGNVVPMLNGDKSVFYRFCLAQGIPTPRLLAIIDRRGSSWGTSGRIFRDRRGFEEFVAAEAPGEFIVKPSRSGMGEGDQPAS